MRRSDGWKSVNVASSLQSRLWPHDRRACYRSCSEFVYVHVDHCVARRSWRSHYFLKDRTAHAQSNHYSTDVSGSVC